MVYLLSCNNNFKLKTDRILIINDPFPSAINLQLAFLQRRLVTALDYKNPYISPYEEFQRFKLHPKVASILEGGECIEYGARTLNEGGLQSLPLTHFPGGALIGDSAGFLNVGKIKGVHTAMKSGMMAAESIYSQFSKQKEGKRTTHVDMSPYTDALSTSWVHEELFKSRNIRPGFSQFGGLIGGSLHAAIDAFIFRGGAPWTLNMKRRLEDHDHMVPAENATKRPYPPPNGTTTFSITESLYRSGTDHEHDQPCHLHLKNPRLPQVVHHPIYGGAEQHYCPAKVYEYIEKSDSSGQNTVELQINAQNCLHCKACDIKDPRRNIQWTVPEGGGGPNYTCS